LERGSGGEVYKSFISPPPGCYNYPVMPDLTDELKSFLLSKGASLVGFADLHEIDSKARDGFPYGISIAIALDPQIMTDIKEGPTRAYYDEYNSLNDKLDKLAQDTAQWLADKGYRAQARVTAFGSDKDTLSARLPHKTVATRAGLGWIGKCALLVTKRFGSAVRLTTVLTDAPLVPGRPVDASLCSHCTHCIEACPAHAHTGTIWQAGMPREALYDAYKCRDTAQKLSLKGFGISYSICGLCIVACPWTKKYLDRAANKT
jgi:epoxyqueuosine reductase